MNNRVVATITFASGVITGFILSNFISIEKGEKTEKVYAKDISKEKEDLVEKPSSPKVNPIHNKKEDTEFVEYSKLSERYKSESNNEEEVDEEEQIQEEIERSEKRKKNKDKIIPITKEDFEYEDDLDFEKKELYYFVSDDILTDDEGKSIDEESFIGKKPRQFGWMANDEEVIYIRNNPQETDYKVWKEKCSSLDWWS